MYPPTLHNTPCSQYYTLSNFCDPALLFLIVFSYFLLLIAYVLKKRQILWQNKNSTLSIHQKINVFCDLNYLYFLIVFSWKFGKPMDSQNGHMYTIFCAILSLSILVTYQGRRKSQPSFYSWTVRMKWFLKWLNRYIDLNGQIVWWHQFQDQWNLTWYLWCCSFLQSPPLNYPQLWL